MTAAGQQLTRDKNVHKLYAFRRVLSGLYMKEHNQ